MSIVLRGSPTVSEISVKLRYLMRSGSNSTSALVRPAALNSSGSGRFSG
jgi:hypothetical protein